MIGTDSVNRKWRYDAWIHYSTYIFVVHGNERRSNLALDSRVSKSLKVALLRHLDSDRVSGFFATFCKEVEKSDWRKNRRKFLNRKEYFPRRVQCFAVCTDFTVLRHTTHDIICSYVKNGAETRMNFVIKTTLPRGKIAIIINTALVFLPVLCLGEFIN